MLLRVLGWVCNALYPECPPWRHMVGGVSCPSRSVALWCICVPGTLVHLCPLVQLGVPRG